MFRLRREILNMVKLNVEYEIDHKIEGRTFTRFRDMATQRGDTFTADTIIECEELILDAIINYEYKPSARAQVQIEALGQRLDEYSKYGINWLIVTYEDHEVVLR